MKTKILTTLSLAILAQTVAAAPIVKSWVNPACASGECEIKGIKLYINKSNKKGLAGNAMSAEIEGSSKAVLSKYAFVQYLKGCVFQQNSAGLMKLATREMLGKNGQPFKHTTWEVDSAADKDPIYWSKSGAGFDEMRGFEIPRNYGYANHNPLISESGGSWAGKVTNLKENKIYVHDMPSMTQLIVKPDMTWGAQNTSLEFMICLHEIKDIPESIDDPKTIVPNPITCMNWSSNYIYERSQFKVVEKTVIHPFCK